MMMAGKAFVDTNVLLRATNSSLPLHTEADRLIRRMRNDEVELWISRQVLREYLAQITRPGFLSPAIPIDQAVQMIQTLQELFIVADETEQVTRHLLALLRAHPTAGKQVHDANIVATMLVNGIDTLLTQNIDDVKRFTEITPGRLHQNHVQGHKSF
jgi:predicted nucleic acid-binding protein